MRNKLPKNLAVVVYVFLAIAINACAPATRTTVFQSYDPKPVGSPIKIFRVKSPNCDFEELGIVNSRQRNKFIPMQEVLESLKVEARSIGGDAILNLTESNPVHSVAEDGSIDRDPVLTGTVIRFTNLDCTE